MDSINNNTQFIAAEKVLEEMKKAEEYVKSWNACWIEQLQNAYCLPLHYEMSEADIRDMERKYEPRYRLANAYYSENSIGVPLIRETLVGNNTLTGKDNVEFNCEFGRIDWYGMDSRNATRRFTFINNGDILFEKKSKRRNNGKHSKQISYSSNYNVLSDDFDIIITLGEILDDFQSKYDFITFFLNGTILTKKFNNIEIIQDLSTGVKTIKITKNDEMNNFTIAYEVRINPDNSLVSGIVIVNTQKGNGKVNGTYKFSINSNNEISANFYSRKGVKFDLNSNPILQQNISEILSTLSPQNKSDEIILNFINQIQKAITVCSSEEHIEFDWGMSEIVQVESKIIEIIKCIKGELPLTGLAERIDNCVSLIESNKRSPLNTRKKY